MSSDEEGIREAGREPTHLPRPAGTLPRQPHAPPAPAWLEPAHGGRAPAGARRPDPAHVHPGRQGPAAGRRHPCRGSSGSRSTCLLPVAERALELGIPAIALFPVTPVERKSEDAREAWNDDNLMCRAIRAIKRHCPELGRDRRRGARPLHQPRPGRPAARRRHPQRRDDRGAGAPGGLPRRRRLRHRGALGHDGRPDRRDPRRRSTRPGSSGR